jgi:hypothetical protein
MSHGLCPMDDSERRPPLTSKVYRIRVTGHLRPEWSEWFDGMNISQEGNGDTILSGPVRDQVPLHGLLVRVRDLGLTLISLSSDCAAEDDEGWDDRRNA